MDLYEVAWTIATMVSRREPNEFKLIMDYRVPYPLVQYVGRPVSEHVLHIPTPEKLVPDEIGLSPLEVVRLRVFRACVAHEACHIYLTDPLVYENPLVCSLPLTSFVSNLIEDCRVETFLANKWPGLGRDIAFANAVAYLRLHPVNDMMDRHKRILLAVVMQTFCGNVKGVLPEDELADIKRICDIIKSIKWSSDAKSLLDAVEAICVIANPEGERSDTNFVLPHNDGKRGWEFYRYMSNNVVPEDFDKTLWQVSTHMGLDRDFINTNKDDVAEAESIFHQEEMSKKLTSRIEERLKSSPTRFRYVGFCPKDYCEYLRIRDTVIPLLKSVENQLASIATEDAEVPVQPSGFLDLTEAIQSIASESPKTDVFTRWKIAERGSAWTILLDNSLSMVKNEYTIREIAIIFGEVLKNICPQEWWALYAFSDVFLVLKDFDERYDKNVVSRLGGISCGGGTFLPDAVELALHSLMQRPQSLKVMVIVSDGQPQGYPGIEDAMMEVMKRVERSGVIAIGIGLKCRGLDRYFRNWCYINRVRDLPREFIRQYYGLVYAQTGMT